MQEGVVRRRQGRPTLDEAKALREDFLNQAFMMVCDRGVHNFSVDALAKTSGVTKRTIYRQYESKAALIEAVVARQILHLNDTAGSPDGELTAIDQLREWGWRLFVHLSRRDTQRLSLVLRVASLTEPWAAGMLRTWTAHLLDTGCALVGSAQERGDLRDADPRELAALLYDLVDGVVSRIRHNLGDQGGDSEPDLEQWFERRWLAFLTLARPDWSSAPRRDAAAGGEPTRIAPTRKAGPRATPPPAAPVRANDD